MENLHVQRKKMSLANIEGKLTLEEMENVMAGSWNTGCAASLVGLGLTYAGAFAITAATGGAGLFAAAFIVGSIGAATSCR